MAISTIEMPQKMHQPGFDPRAIHDAKNLEDPNGAVSHAAASTGSTAKNAGRFNAQTRMAAP